MSIEDGFEFVKDAFVDMHWFGAEWVIPLMVIFMSMVLITRDKEEWKVLFFPMCVGWLIAGLRPSYVLVFLGGVVFVVNELSLRVLGNVLSSTKIFGKGVTTLDRDWETKT